MNTIEKQAMSLSDRLKAAREAGGWSIEDVGAQLHLPARVIQRIESGDLDALGAPVYRRGYLRSFARLVGVPEDEIEAALVEQRTPDPELVATGVTPRGQYMTERYLRPVTYIALTALIAVPVVWYAASGRLSEELARSRPIDLRTPVVASTTNAASEGYRNATSDEQGWRGPVRASVFPAPSPEQVTVVPRPPQAGAPVTAPAQAADGAESAEAVAGVGESEAAAGTVVGDGKNLVVLELTEDSWVDVLDARGSRVHQAVMTPGTWRFRSDGKLSFTIGNSRTARLQVNGEAVDLAAHRSPSDVARIELLGDDG